MMADLRVIVFRNYHKLDRALQKRLSQALKDTPETTLALVEGEKGTLNPKPPKKFYHTEKFGRIYENKLPGWIKKQFQKRGKDITPKGVALLINNVGDVLFELDSEIEKITIAAGDSEMVDESAVGAIVGEFRRYTVYNLCNQIGLGSFGEALHILENLMENEPNKESYFLAVLSGHIMKLAKYNALLRSGMSPDEAVDELGENKFLWKNINRMNVQAKKFRAHDIRRALIMLGRTESMLKHSKIDNELLMEFMVPYVMPR
jgi:DNA polymerase-3 subunit delta